MDLKKYLVINHPQILKQFEESKETPQPPNSAPGNVPQSQSFRFPPYSPILATHEFFPEIVYPKSPSPTLSGASTQMSSPTKTIPETQLSQSPSQSPPKYKYKPGLSQEDLMQLQNRI